MKINCNICNKHRKSKNPKISLFLMFTVSVIMNMKEYLKKNNQLKYQKSMV